MKILRSIYVNATNGSASYPDPRAKERFDMHSWPFRLEKGWTYVDDIEDADVVPFMYHSTDYDILNLLKPNQIGLALSIFHVDESLTEIHYKKTLKDIRKKYPLPIILIVHKNSRIKDGDGLIHYDCMFNRAKLYYTEYEKVEKIIKDIKCDLVWTARTNEKNFTLPEIEKRKVTDKIFLNPGLIYSNSFHYPRMRYRLALNDFLTTKHDNIGIISKPGNRLLPEPFTEDNIRWIQDTSSTPSGYWMPIGNSYYEKTYVSIYVETLTVSGYPTSCITEKTYDPLIKGHFILPFAYSGFIQELKSFGFKFPDFIDYSYDETKDNDVRFKEYTNLIRDLLLMPKSEWHTHYSGNLDILHHNRSLIFNKQYDTLYDKVKLGRLTQHKSTNHSSNL